jgi:biotin carboxyl carrier protein
VIPKEILGMPEQIVKAPMKARVIEFLFQQGDSVKDQELVCNLEAMKMEVPIMAPAAGTIKEINASPGDNVQAGDALFTLET